MSSFPLANSIIFQDGYCYCTTNQLLSHGVKRLAWLSRGVIQAIWIVIAPPTSFICGTTHFVAYTKGTNPPRWCALVDDPWHPPGPSFILRPSPQVLIMNGELLSGIVCKKTVRLSAGGKGACGSLLTFQMQRSGPVRPWICFLFCSYYSHNSQILQRSWDAGEISPVMFIGLESSQNCLYPPWTQTWTKWCASNLSQTRASPWKSGDFLVEMDGDFPVPYVELPEDTPG